MVIRIQCDKCDKTIEVNDSLAGQKIDCPHCGDVNRIPAPSPAAPPPAAAPATQAPPQAPPVAPSPAADRPSAMGLPPDSGPEKHVMTVKPAMFRAHPVLGLITTLIWIGGIVAAIYFSSWWWLIATAVGLLFIAAWWVKKQTVRLEITNKRCILREGLLSRATNEVLHDHVRNIQTDQSLFERILNVGSVGISSAGQDGIEIMVDDLPNPDRIREIVDAYRPI